MLLFTDVDNTLIYSKNRVKNVDGMVCVEKIGEEPHSFMPIDAFNKASFNKEFIVPISTRTVEQYERLMLPEFRTVLLNNGGILLRDGSIDIEWLDQSMQYAKECKDTLLSFKKLLKQDKNLLRRVDFIDNMFLFTKSSDAESTCQALKECEGYSEVTVERQGCKVYVFPKKLTKGYAVKRFLRENPPDGVVIAAGDNHLDFSMADEVNLFITSSDEINGVNIVNSPDTVFVDRVLSYF